MVRETIATDECVRAMERSKTFRGADATQVLSGKSLTIARPQEPWHQHRDVACYFTLEGPFKALVDQAIAAGWTRSEVTSALIMHAWRAADDVRPRDLLSEPRH